MEGVAEPDAEHCVLLPEGLSGSDAAAVARHDRVVIHHKVLAVAAAAVAACRP